MQGYVGASRIFVSSLSNLYGNVAPAPVNLTPRFLQSSSSSFDFEVFLPSDPIDGYMDYWGVQYLIVGDCSDFQDTKVGDISIFVTEHHPTATYEGEYFVIEAGTFHIKCRYDRYNFE